ncbi:N-6 DNA methylase [Candidatus Woesearchaeota archaeon]|nr:N-6 DNA methylase [Candidatus Woesearchaeota archaeon]
MRNLFCDEKNLINEATVESLFVDRLLTFLIFKDENIKRKNSIQILTIGKGSKKEQHKPDYVCFVKSKPKIVIDAKDPKEDVDDYIYQTSGYSLSLNQKFDNENPVEYFILTNGFILKLFKWDNERPILTLKFKDFEKNNPKLEKLQNIISFKILSKRKPQEIQDLVKGFEFRKPKSNNEIEAIFRACHQIIWRKDNIKPSEAFPEFAKLSFIKIHYDRKIHDMMRRGEKPKKEDYTFSVDWIEKQEKELNEDNPVSNILFKKLREDLEDEIKKGIKKRIFNSNEELNINASTIKEVVRLLEHYNLFGIDEDLNGRMFEAFLSATVRGEALGQFFTPRTVVKCMTQMAKIKSGKNKIDVVLDGFCGSGGFLIEAMTIMREKIEKNKSLTDKEIENLKDKIVQECLYGIDADKSPYFKISRIARMNMVMHGDGNNRIYWLPDTLDKNIEIEKSVNKELRQEAEELKAKIKENDLKFDIVLTNPPFSRGYNKNKKDEAKILDKYDIAHKEDTNKLKSIRSNVLSLEVYRDLLKPHGKLITVMDESVLNSYSGREYRKFIKKYFIVKAVISLPQNAFFNADANVKTSILYLVKKDNEDEEQGDVFMAVSNNIGHSDSGKSDLESCDLLKVYDYSHKVVNEKIDKSILEKFLEYEENGYLEKEDDTAFIIKKEEIATANSEKEDELKGRLDCYSHMPSYKKLLKELKNLEKDGKVELLKGEDLDVIDQMSKEEYDKLKTKTFKYIDIGNTEKDLGMIRGSEEDLLIALPTRARMLIKENDILIPAPVHSASGIIIIPKEYEGQLCSNGFIVIRPKDYSEAVLIYTILKSEFLQKQFFHLQSGINQQMITDRNFKNFVYIPIPKKVYDKEKMIKNIKSLIGEAKKLKENYSEKLVKIQDEFLEVIS